MFLEWIQALNFLTKTDEEGIFLPFPVASRRVIGKEVTEVLLKGSVSVGTIKSPVNVKVLMECVGQCFGLPIHDCADIIAAATELYRRWLFEPELRPPPIAANQDLFYLEILKHSSLLFQPRAALAKEVLPVHVKLCETVLEVYRRIAKDVPLTKYLWERFIEIMISIADFLLKKKVEEEPLADRLTPNILRTLFEVFLLSQTKNDKLWDALKTLLNEWRHRRPVILQWNAMCIGLTARTVRLLYGPSVGADAIHFQLEEVPSSQFQLPDEFAQYAWARILYLLGDLELIPTGPNYADAMKGIQALTNYLIAVKPPTAALAAGTTPAPFRIPDGNTVLKVVGHWIFEAINNYKQQGYEKGKAYALETACVLFCSKSRTVFNARYLAFLYRGLEEAMKLRHPALSAVIVMNLTSFFPNEFPGCNVLIPSLVYTVARILLEVGTSNAQLRKACIRLVGTLLCYPNTYSGITFKQQSSLTFTYQGYTQLAPISKYDDIAEHFGRSLLESLRTEEDADNKQILIYTLLLHVLENMNFDMAFVFKFVAVLVEKIGIVWGPENIHHALIALSQLANVYHLFQHVENSEAVAAHVVAELCKFIERYYTPGIKKEFIEDVVVEAFFCIIDWIMQPNQWLLHSSKIVIAILGCVEIATTGKKTGATGTYHPSTARAREAGEYLLYYLLNQFGQFPPPTGPTSLSTPVKEPDLMAADNLSSRSVQCFLFDKTLVTVVSYPRSTSIELGLLLRDQSGRYNWQLSLNLFPLVITTPADPPGDTDTMLPPPLAPQEADDEFLQELGSFLDDTAHRMHGAILRQASERAIIEENHLAQHNYGLSPNVTVQIPQKPVSDASKYDAVPARLFLTQSGFLSLENRFHFQSLQVSQQRPFNMLQNFKNLDLTPQRECFCVGVLYVNRQVRADPWETIDATRGYFDFVRYLGWEVEVVSHAGFLGGLDPVTTGDTAPYWANHLYEVIFYVATMMPNGEPAQMQATKKRLVNGAPVLITWVEDGEDLDGASTLAPDQYANIVIIPLRSGLYRVKVFRKAGFGFFGPLLNDVVVSRHVLPYTVRCTAVQACRLAARSSPNLRPLSQRKFILEDFTKRNAVSVPMSKLYGAQFAPV